MSAGPTCWAWAAPAGSTACKRWRRSPRRIRGSWHVAVRGNLLRGLRLQPQSDHGGGQLAVRRRGRRLPDGAGRLRRPAARPAHRRLRVAHHPRCDRRHALRPGRHQALVPSGAGHPLRDRRERGEAGGSPVAAARPEAPRRRSLDRPLGRQEGHRRHRIQHGIERLRHAAHARVLRNYGNLSSASVLFSYEKLCRERVVREGGFGRRDRDGAGDFD